MLIGAVKRPATPWGWIVLAVSGSLVFVLLAIVTLNIETFAQATGLDRLWGSRVGSLTFIEILGGVAVFLIGFLVGHYGEVWLRRAIPGTPNPIADRTVFERETVRLVDLVGADPVISGRRFKQCVIKGPLMLKPQMATHLRFCRSEFDPGDNFAPVRTGSAILGAVLGVDLVFEECFFEGISLVGTADDKRVLQEGFIRQSKAEWMRERGLDL